jgi:hypothetical protein
MKTYRAFVKRAIADSTLSNLETIYVSADDISSALARVLAVTGLVEVINICEESTASILN